MVAHPLSALGQANVFVAKWVLDLGTTKALIERLSIDRSLRRICGFSMHIRLPARPSSHAPLTNSPPVVWPSGCMKYSSKNTSAAMARPSPHASVPSKKTNKALQQHRWSSPPNGVAHAVVKFALRSKRTSCKFSASKRLNQSAVSHFYSSARTTKPATSWPTDYCCGGSTEGQNCQGSSCSSSIWAMNRTAMDGAASFFCV